MLNKRFSLLLLLASIASIIILALSVQVKAIFALPDQSASIEPLDAASRMQEESNDAQTEFVAKVVLNDIILKAEGTEVEVLLNDVPSDAVVTGVGLKIAGVDGDGEAIDSYISAPDSSPALISSSQVADGETTHALDGSSVYGAWTIKLIPQEAAATERTVKLILLVHYETAVARLPKLKAGAASNTFLRLPAPVWELSTPLSERSGDTAQAAAGAPTMPENWELIEYQGFEETSFPDWYIFDESDDGYERYWCPTDYLSYIGNKSAWPACGGSDGVSPWNYYYPDNMDTWLIYGPFSLSDADQAVVLFSLWHTIEAEYDHIFFGASTDGFLFSGNYWDGDAPSWENIGLDFSDYVGEGEVWVAWNFYSDSSVTFEGPFVDEVTISKYVSSTASATPYPTNTPTVTPEPSSTATSPADTPTITATPTLFPSSTANNPANTPTSTITATPSSTANNPANTPTSTTNNLTNTPTRTPLPPTPPPTRTPTGYPDPVGDSIRLDVWPGDASINLEWMLDGSLSGDLYQYELYRKADEGNFSLIHSTMHSQYTDEAPDLTEGVEYCYQVKAINSANQVIDASYQECTTIGHLTLWVPDETAPPDTTDIPVMINLANGNGLCIEAMDIKIDYDETIVAPTGLVSPTIYTQGYAFIANNIIPGQVKISSITGQCNDLYGAGSLFNVFFNIQGSEGEISPLDFIKGLTATVIYDQDDLLTPVDLALQNGSLTVAYSFIRGDTTGDGVVNAADAALALRIASGTHTPTAKELAACDVNGDSVCNSADSNLILCYASFQDWEHCGGSQSTTRLSEPTQQGGIVDLAIGELVREEQTIRYPIEITNGPELTGGEFVFAYDPIQMIPSEVNTDLLTNGFELQSNLLEPGMLHVSIASSQPIGGDGTILELEFTSLTGGTSSLDFGAVRLYDASGRDLYSSALQRDIRLNAIDGDPRHLLYLPAITR